MQKNKLPWFDRMGMERQTRNTRISKKISKKKPAIEFPKEIRELAQEFRRQRVEKEQAATLEKRKMDAEQKRVRAARLKKGLKCATKVFLWAKALKESNIGQEFMKNSYSDLIFFDSHIVGVKWRGLGISSNGLFLAYGGRSSYRQQVSSPKDLTESVQTVILEMASEWIDSGEVWDCIKRRINYPKK